METVLVNPRIPFPDSFWVDPGRLLAGEYPGAPEEEMARKKLRSLLQSGVDFCIDLTEKGALVPYESWWRSEAADYLKEAGYLRMPIRDFGVPSADDMVRILDAIDQALEHGKTVYVHCWGGIGRTGTVIGCYLVRHGLTGEQALDRLAHLRVHVPDASRQSPETSEQAGLVLRWQAEERNFA
jgi:protein-tyrosine phosphatase